MWSDCEIQPWRESFMTWYCKSLNVLFHHSVRSVNKGGWFGLFAVLLNAVGFSLNVNFTIGNKDGPNDLNSQQWLNRDKWTVSDRSNTRIGRPLHSMVVDATFRETWNLKVGGDTVLVHGVALSAEWGSQTNLRPKHSTFCQCWTVSLFLCSYFAQPQTS